MIEMILFPRNDIKPFVQLFLRQHKKVGFSFSASNVGHAHERNMADYVRYDVKEPRLVVLDAGDHKTRGIRWRIFLILAFYGRTSSQSLFP